MSINTPRLQLHKPAPPETVNVDQDLNNNSDKVDLNIGYRVVTSGTRPAAPYTGQLIYETDTKLQRFWNGSKWFDISERFVRKGTTESVTSSAVLQDDNELFLAMEVNSRYDLELFLRYEAVAAGDLKFKFTGPAGFTFQSILHRLSSAATSITDDSVSYTDESNTPIPGGLGAGSEQAVMLKGTVLCSGTAGNLQLQWAQNTADATATKVILGSYLKFKQLT